MEELNLLVACGMTRWLEGTFYSSNWKVYIDMQSVVLFIFVVILFESTDFIDHYSTVLYAHGWVQNGSQVSLLLWQKYYSRGRWPLVLSVGVKTKTLCVDKSQVELLLINEREIFDTDLKLHGSFCFHCIEQYWSAPTSWHGGWSWKWTPLKSWINYGRTQHKIQLSCICFQNCESHIL